MPLIRPVSGPLSGFGRMIARDVAAGQVAYASMRDIGDSRDLWFRAKSDSGLDTLLLFRENRLRMRHPQTQYTKLGTTIYRPLWHFEAIDLSFHRVRTSAQREHGFNGLAVSTSMGRLLDRMAPAVVRRRRQSPPADPLRSLGTVLAIGRQSHATGTGGLRMFCGWTKAVRAERKGKG